jgi:hypothetical protein
MQLKAFTQSNQRLAWFLFARLIECIDLRGPDEMQDWILAV